MRRKNNYGRLVFLLVILLVVMVVNAVVDKVTFVDHQVNEPPRQEEPQKKENDTRPRE